MHSRKKEKNEKIILYAVIGALAVLNVVQFIVGHSWMYNDVLPDEVAALSMADFVAENVFGEKFVSPEIRYVSATNTWVISESIFSDVENPGKEIAMKKDSGRVVKITSGSSVDDSHIAL